MLNAGMIMESLWRILGDGDPLKFSIFFLKLHSNCSNIRFCIFPFSCPLQYFLFCPHVKLLPPLKLMLPSPITFDPFLHLLHRPSVTTPNSTENISILLLVFLSYPIAVITLKMSVSKRRSLANVRLQTS